MPRELQRNKLPLRTEGLEELCKLQVSVPSLKNPSLTRGWGCFGERREITHDRMSKERAALKFGSLIFPLDFISEG